MLLLIIVAALQTHCDGLVQQLLPDVQAEQQHRHDAGGVSGDREAADGAQAEKGQSRRQEEEGRDLGRLVGLHAQDSARRLAPTGQHHRRGRDQQSLHLPRPVTARWVSTPCVPRCVFFCCVDDGNAAVVDDVCFTARASRRVVSCCWRPCPVCLRSLRCVSSPVDSSTTVCVLCLGEHVPHYRYTESSGNGCFSFARYCRIRLRSAVSYQ